MSREGQKTMYFPYGETETAYLKSRDKKLGAVIEQLGHICLLYTSSSISSNAFSKRSV